jgi:alpha-glucosidase
MQRCLAVLVGAVTLALGCPAGIAQTLARPGWAGSGVAIEPWWWRAVFYRIDPAHFQDSDGDGIGDLPGVAARLGYLQSLGVDAIVLRLPQESATPELQSGFESLARAAAERKLRVLVELDASPNDADETSLGAARFWLNQGAAGIVLDSATFPADSDEQAAAFVHSMHTLLSGFPGGRILVADAAQAGNPMLAKALAQSAQLVARKPLTAATSATALRTEMEAALSAEPASTAPAPTRPRTISQHRVRMHETEPANFLWSAAGVQLLSNIPASQQLALQRTMVMLLLASRVAVMIDYGEEIGLNAGPDSPMQWTPKNVTPPPPVPIERQATATITDGPIPPKPKPQPKPQSNVYGPYVPYVPPAKVKPPGTPDTDMPGKIDPDTLPGFTTGTLPGTLNADAATVNVAVEDTDQHSLLNFYRKLIQLHHGNASLHNGAETVLDHDDLNALLWVRRPPPSAATATTVVAVCNLSEKPLDISLGDELKLRGGAFRTLAGDANVSGDRISVLPGAVWLGEWRR